MGFPCRPPEDRRLVEARDARDLEERRDRPDAFDRVSLPPELFRPLWLLRAYVVLSYAIYHSPALALTDV